MEANENDVSAFIADWKATQRAMRERMIFSPLPCPLPRFVAGADCAFSPGWENIFAVALVYDRDARRIVEIAHAIRKVEFPYVPGFLSFREGPAVIEALQKLAHPFGALLYDGHGFSHPRRCGIAAHVAITLDIPGVGVAKSILTGSHDEVPREAGSRVPLLASRAGARRNNSEQIGVVLRTKKDVRPVFVSVGHRADLETAVELTLACVTKYRLPEPTRLADIEVAKLKRSQTSGADENRNANDETGQQNLF